MPFKKHNKRRDVDGARVGGPRFEELESRLLLSADVSGLVVDATPVIEPAIIQSIDLAAFAPSSSTSAAAAVEARKELVLIDPRVSDYGQIVSDLLGPRTDGRSIDIVVLDPTRDGIQQVSDALADRHDLSALHIISHGRAGTVELGATELDANTLFDNAGAIQQWRNAFTDDADIMLYGCDVAATPNGHVLIDALSRFTGADVAASDDATGAHALGGDWLLEVDSGAIETTVAPSAALQASWQGLLAVTTDGGETQVDTGGPGTGTIVSQTRNVAIDSNGNSVVVWQDSVKDGSGNGVYAQRYDASGVAQGAEFRVNTTTFNNQMSPSVAMGANGDFVVAWYGDNVDPTVIGTIYAQRYDANGVAQGGEFIVNTTQADNQMQPAIATGPGGNFVIAWCSDNQDGSGGGIYAQRYDANGVAQGGEFRVNTTTLNVQDTPAIAMNDVSNFVIVWNSANQDGSGYGVYGQRYNSSGVAQGSEFRVNTTTADNQYNPSVSMDALGNFVVVWTSDNQDGSGSGIYGKRYNYNGVAQGSEFQINATTASAQSNPSVSMRRTDGFYVTWDSWNQDGDQAGIYLREYDTAGNPLTGETLVNTTTVGDQRNASVAVNDDGQLVVVWHSDSIDVAMQRYTHNIAPFLITTQTPLLNSINEDAPAPVGAVGTLVSDLVDFDNPLGQVDNVIDNDPGALLGIAVAYTDTTNGTWWYTTDGGTNWLSLDTVSGTSARLLAADANTRVYFRPTANFNGTASMMLLAWDQTTGSNGGLADTTGRGGNSAISQYAVNAYVTVNAVNDAPVLDNTKSPALNAVSEGAPVPVGAVGTLVSNLVTNGMPLANVSDADSGALFGIAVTAVDTSNGAWWYTTDGGTNWFALGAVTTDNALQLAADANTRIYFQPNADFIGTIAAGLTFHAWDQTAGSNGTYSGTSINGGTTEFSSATDTVPVTVTAVNDAPEITFGEMRVNTVTTDTQDMGGNKNVAMDANGNYVVTWMSFNHDGSSYGIYAQRFNSVGVAQGAEFLVNTTTANNQAFPAVAMDASGNFVIVWESFLQDGSGNGIYAQRYNSSGVAQGSEFRVNVTTANDQQLPSIAMDASGNFIVVWESPDSGGTGVYARRYNAAGVAQGGEFRANTTTAGNQSSAKVAIDASGNFVIVWSSTGQDGSGDGIYAQRYNAAGVAQGSEFLVNTTTANNQQLPSVAMEAGGNFVVVWSSAGQDGSGMGIYAQRYDSAGVAQGAEFRINVTTNNDQTSSAIAMLPSGGFIVAWASDQQDGSGYGIYTRKYDAAGNALTGETLVNATTSGWQLSPSVAVDDTGRAVIVWSGNGSGDADGIFMRRYDYSRTPPTMTLNEDAPAPSGAVGTLVSSLVDFASPSGQVDNVLDRDSGAVLGIAVTAADTSNGTWWYTTDGGSNWLALGAVSDSNARQLAAAANTRIYFRPSANFNGTIAPALTFRAWDQTTGSNGALADASSNGGATAFSMVTDTASVVVTAVNDAPVLDPSKLISVTVNEDALAPSGAVGTLVSSLVDFASPSGQVDNVTEQDAGALLGIAVTYADIGSGNWWYTTDGGTNWLALGGTFTNARLLSADANTRVYYQSTANFNGAVGAALDFRAWDQTSGSNGGLANTVVCGGSTAFSIAIGTVDVVVNAVNDAPVITSNGGGVTAAISVAENTNTVTTVTATDVDVPANTLSYSIVGGADGLRFSIDSVTGVLTFAVAPNFEVPSDANTDNVYDVTVQVSDGNGSTDTQQISVTVTDANEAPSLVPTTQGGETRVNTTTANSQSGGTVAMDANGNYVVTWSAADANGAGIFAQRYNAAGVAQGGEFQVNTTTANNQFAPTIALAASGNFVIAWQSWSQDGSLYGVYAQRYNAAGVAQGGEFRVNTTTVGDQSTPSIAIDASGNFVIAWTNLDLGLRYNVYAQRYNAAGVAQGGEFRVNTTINGQSVPVVAMDSVGNFVVVWQSNDGSGWGVYAQRYNAAGVAQGGEFRVNTTTANDQMDAAVAMDATGNFVVTWHSRNNDGDGWGICAQCYNSAGAAQGSEFLVNVTTADWQQYPTVTMRSSGGFVIAWQSINQDGSGYGVYLHEYDASGNAISGETRVSSTTSGNQQNARIAVDDIGHMVVVWNGNGSGDNDGVFMQRYAYANSPVLSTENEDSPAPVGAVGTLVSSLVDFASPSGQIDNISDPDAGALLGIAVTGADTTYGFTGFTTDWWYTTDGGANWLNLGAVSNTNARLLAADANTRLYFRPAADFNGTVSDVLTFRAWDRTTGANGALANTSVNGGSSSFSSTTETASIVITAVNDTPVITSNGAAATAAISVAEGTTAVTTVTATDVDVPAPTLTYSIVGGADAAHFAIDSTTGALVFVVAPIFGTPTDVGADNIYDVTVQVADGNGGTDMQAISVSVATANTAPTGSDATITTAEDVAYVFDVTDFGFNDADVGDSLSAVRIDMLPVNGTLTLAGAAVSAGQIVTAADLVAGNFVYTSAANANGVAYASIRFSVCDQSACFAASPNRLTIDVTPVNDAPVLATNTGLTLLQGANATVTPLQLATTDVDNSDVQLVYTLTALPTAGVLQLDGVALGLNDTFTQADLNANRVSYRHNNTTAATDVFGFIVADGSGAMVGSSFAITVTLVIPPDPVTSPAPPVNGGAPVPPAPISSPAPSTPPVMGVDGGVTTDVPYVSTWRPLPSAKPTSNPSLAATQRTASMVPDVNASASFTASVSSRGPVTASSIPAPGNVHSFNALGRALDDMRTQLREGSTPLFTSATTFSGAILTVGFISWILRGGALAASLIATTPLWNRFDPLPILARRRRKNEREEATKEHLAVMHDHRERALRKLFPVRPGAATDTDEIG
ncbi:MAG: DUF4347 domain-containing protein [Gammaproteobacteria bacterium]|nr:DUF4347 domain-containing protein [Gammaproteobacteria bacterium]